MNCKKYGLILLIVFYCLCLQAQNINISGENKATFLHRTAKDSLHNYFENELKFRVDRGAFTFGMSFIAELPAYDDTMPEKELDRDKLHTRWDDLFVQLKFDDFRLKVGTIDESYGVGLILRSWNNPDVSADKRMNGVQAQYNYQDFKIKGLYGKMKEDIVDDDINDTDLVAGIDAEYQFSDSFTFGASALEYKQDQSYVAGKSYTYKEIYGARAGLSFDAFDLELESAGMKTFH
ncbi:MAG: DUF6029 family protein, partial [Candidatus Cloacimonetes bacterium]|nr:DUF6029 family protein [Candidatus Cloacimonadota bacterium]